MRPVAASGMERGRRRTCEASLRKREVGAVRSSRPNVVPVARSSKTTRERGNAHSLVRAVCAERLRRAAVVDELVDPMDELFDLLDKLRTQRQRLNKEGADPALLAAATELEAMLERGIAHEAEWRQRRAAQWRDPEYKARLRRLYGTGTVH